MPTCKFFQSSVKYLGHIVSKDGISTDDEKIVSMVNWKVPQTVKELISFLTEIKTIPIEKYRSFINFSKFHKLVLKKEI